MVRSSHMKRTVLGSRTLFFRRDHPSTIVLDLLGLDNAQNEEGNQLVREIQDRSFCTHHARPLVA